MSYYYNFKIVFQTLLISKVLCVDAADQDVTFPYYLVVLSRSNIHIIISVWYQQKNKNKKTNVGLYQTSSKTSNINNINTG